MSSRNVRVYQSVIEELRRRIGRGDWAAGERLPGISELALELQAGIGSVREALRALQSLGLVRIVHGRGVFVTGTPIDDLAEHFQDNALGMIVALAETRRILEPELAALAAERASAAELLHISDLARQMEHEALSGQEFVEPDVEFHYQIARAARNPILFRMLESVNDLFLESRRITAQKPGMTERAVRYHLLIADALLQRDSVQVRLLMQAHMNDSLSGLLMG